MISLMMGSRVIAAVPAGIQPSPPYPNLYDSAFGSSSAQAIATFTARSNGQWVGESNSGNWYNPTTVAIGDGYTVRFTPTLIDGSPGLLTNGAATFQSLSVDRVLELKSQRFTNGTSSSTYSVLVEIQLGGLTVSSGTFLMTTEATVTGGGGGGPEP